MHMLQLKDFNSQIDRGHLKVDLSRENLDRELVEMIRQQWFERLDETNKVQLEFHGRAVDEAPLYESRAVRLARRGGLPIVTIWNNQATRVPRVGGPVEETLHIAFAPEIIQVNGAPHLSVARVAVPGQEYEEHIVVKGHSEMPDHLQTGLTIGRGPETASSIERVDLTGDVLHSSHTLAIQQPHSFGPGSSLRRVSRLREGRAAFSVILTKASDILVVETAHFDDRTRSDFSVTHHFVPNAE
jgi:hypothetical protein